MNSRYRPPSFQKQTSSFLPSSQATSPSPSPFPPQRPTPLLPDDDDDGALSLCCSNPSCAALRREHAMQDAIISTLEERINLLNEFVGEQQEQQQQRRPHRHASGNMWSDALCAVERLAETRGEQLREKDALISDLQKALERAASGIRVEEKGTQNEDHFLDERNDYLLHELRVQVERLEMENCALVGAVAKMKKCNETLLLMTTAGAGRGGRAGSSPHSHHHFSIISSFMDFCVETHEELGLILLDIHQTTSGCRSSNISIRKQQEAATIQTDDEEHVVVVMEAAFSQTDLCWDEYVSEMARMRRAVAEARDVCAALDDELMRRHVSSSASSSVGTCHSMSRDGKDDDDDDNEENGIADAVAQRRLAAYLRAMQIAREKVNSTAVGTLAHTYMSLLLDTIDDEVLSVVVDVQ
eukprot:PhM_4_TR10357/c3_g1_i1/m.80288